MKKSSLLNLLLASAFVLSACGGGDSGGQADRPSSAVGTACTEENSHQNVDGVELICTSKDGGPLVWLQFGDGTANGGMGVSGNGDANAVNNVSGVPTLAQQFSKKGNCEKRDVSNLAYGPAANIDAIRVVVPMGSLTRKHVQPTDHAYIRWKNAKTGANDITAQADGYAVQVEGETEQGNGDYNIVVEYSCDVYASYNHVDLLVGPLASMMGKNTRGNNDTMNVRIAVKAGEVIGKAGEMATDWSLYDQRVMVKGVHAKNFSQDATWTIHTIAPTQLLAPAVKSQYEALYGGSSNPVGGKFDYDIDGTPQGNWFQKNTNFHMGLAENRHKKVANGDVRGYFDTFFSWIRFNMDPSVFMVGVGDFGGSGTAAVVDKIDPSTVKAGQVNLLTMREPVYQTKSGRPVDMNTQGDVPKDTTVIGGRILGYLLVRLNSDGTLTLEKRPGASASKSLEFSSKALTYER